MKWINTTRFAPLALTCALLLGLLTGCGDTSSTESSAPPAASTAQPVEIIVFAAASMTDTVNQAVELYKDVAPEVTVVCSFDSSGTLKDQIAEGASCDLFIAASQRPMNQLDITADPEVNTDQLDFVDDATRVNILENKVVLAVPDGNPANITSFQDLLTDKLTLLAIGNSDVPVGDYTLEILESLGTNAEALEAQGKLTYGSNVREVTTQVSENAADAGIIYATDAFSAGLTVADTATKDMCRAIIYPAAVLKTAAQPEAAQAFLDFLRSDACTPIFEAVGFTVVTE